MHRREFGARILRAAAALGLRSVSAAQVAAVQAALSACSNERKGQSKADHDGTVERNLADAASGSLRDASAYDAGGAYDGGAPDTGVLRDASTHGNGVRSVIIVGSGYGAAVTALRLTEKGIPVTILEMGRLWNTPGSDGKVFCPLLAPDGRAMWFKDRTEAVIQHFAGLDTGFSVPRQAGVLDVLGPDEMRVFCGRGVGGGSLVNLSIYVTPLREVFERVLPQVDAAAMYATYYPRARQFLRANQVPEDLISADCYQYSRVGIAAAEGIGITCDRVVSGYDYDYMRKEIAGTVPRSALGGEAAFGNNYGKRSLDKTYLADAMGTGLLTIHSLHQVTTIVPNPAGGYVVRAKEINIDGDVIAEKELPCSHLFLCGGSMGTTQLLVRARDRGDLPNLNRAIGTQWGPNSDIFVARDNPLWQPTGTLQASVPSSSFRTLDGDGKHVFSMIIPFPVGLETYISLNIVMTENPEAGHFVYDAANDAANLRWSASQNEPAVKSARFVFDAINTKSSTNYSQGLFAAGDVIGDRATYHPLGGCPLGSATDAYGRVHGYTGLYIMDGSLIPVGLGGNPALTITALAERNIERLIGEDLSI